MQFILCQGCRERAWFEPCSYCYAQYCYDCFLKHSCATTRSIRRLPKLLEQAQSEIARRCAEEKLTLENYVIARNEGATTRELVSNVMRVARRGTPFRL